MKNQNRIIEIIVVSVFIGILLVSIAYTKKEKKRREEFKSSQLATFDSLLIVYKNGIDSILNSDTLHINCVSCGYKNDKTLLWFKNKAQ